MKKTVVAAAIASLVGVVAVVRTDAQPDPGVRLGRLSTDPSGPPVARGPVSVEVKRGNKFGLSFGRCAHCPSVDIDTDTTAGKGWTAIINHLTEEVALGDTELDGISSTLWSAASRVARNKGITYADPADAKTRDKRIKARLSYLCTELGLSKECR